MKLNRFLLLGAIAIVGAVAVVKSIQYNEDKRYAEIEIKGSVGYSCRMNESTSKLADLNEKRAAEKPDDKLWTDAAKLWREKANETQAACQKVEDFYQKYGR